MTVRAALRTCFKEADPKVPLFRRAAAEGIGTMLLVFAASACGMAAVRLLPNQPGAVAFMVAVTVAGVLVALIIAFGRVSGGHYNPLITGLQFLTGERSLKCAVGYVLAQVLGGIVGGVAAAALWHEPSRSAGGLGWSGFASEFVASAGLMLIVFGSSRSGQLLPGPFAAGAWLVGAILSTPTGSYANPAMVVGALMTAGPLAIGIGSAAPYVSAEITGAFVALLIVSVIFSRKQVMG